MKKVFIVGGARPNFMKIAPLWKRMQKYPDQFRPVFVHTGQHYDHAMSQVFLDQLGLPAPDIYLDVGSGSHGQQTASVMIKFEEAVLADRPDLVMVVGDVNSTMACALVAAKLHIPVAHVEAGLRSFDREMPEEINRILTDQLSDYLLMPSEDARINLLNEGIPDENIHFVGNIMIESLIQCSDQIDRSNILNTFDLAPQSYAILTLHRPSNVDNPDVFCGILYALKEIQEHLPILFPAHPRVRKQMTEFGVDMENMGGHGIQLLDPMPYFDFLALQKQARVAITDSGGIQEESTYFNVPCLTIRENTERPITITEGTNHLCGTKPEKILSDFYHVMKNSAKSRKIPDRWDGEVSERIVQIVR